MIRLTGISLAGRYGLNNQLYHASQLPRVKAAHSYCMQVQKPEFFHTIQPTSIALTKSNFTSAIEKDDIRILTCAKFAKGTRKIKMYLFDS